MLYVLNSGQPVPVAALNEAVARVVATERRIASKYPTEPTKDERNELAYALMLLRHAAEECDLLTDAGVKCRG